jgi:hypothetical protein
MSPSRTGRPWLLALLCAALLGVATLGGCTSSDQATQRADDGPAFVEIDNRQTRQAAVYVRDDVARTRIGTVSGVSIDTLKIPARFVSPPRELRFEVDLLAGPTVFGRRYFIEPGDLIYVNVPVG